MRGLSEANGSWKIICEVRRIARNSRVPAFVTSWPSMTIEPAVGVSSRMMARPVVDLPQPDSPTSESVSPGRRSKETFSTA